MKIRVKKPNKEYCLLMAHYYCVNKDEKLMWNWLFVWGFYKIYMEEYAGKTN
jgi:hypothetical protein